MPSVGEQRFTAELYRILGLRESTALELLQDVMPVLPILDPASPELLFQRGEQRYVSTKTAPANGAGTFAQVIMNFPDKLSGKVAIIEKVQALSNTGAALTNLDWRIGPYGLGAGPAVGVALDNRNLATSSLRLSTTGVAAPTGTFVWQSGLGAAGGAVPNAAEDPLPMVIGGQGDPSGNLIGLAVNTGLANADLTVFVVWRERSVGGGELRSF
jgi:hypothetical protein